MSIVDKATLKTYFSDGSRPLGADFANLIDSLAHVNSAFSNGGNFFGSTAVLGTNDNNSLELKTNNLVRMSVASSGAVSFSSSFDASSGTAAFAGITISPVYNQTGTATGVVRGIHYNPVITSIVGQYYAFESASGDIKFGGTEQKTYLNDLYILDNNGVDYKSALYSSVNNELRIGTGFATVLMPSGNLNLGTISTDNITIGRTDYATPVYLRGRISMSISSNHNPSLLTLNGSKSDAVPTPYQLITATPTITQTGTNTATTHFIYYNPTLTTLGTHYAWESTSGDMLVGGNGCYKLNESGTAKKVISLASNANNVAIGEGFAGVQLKTTGGTYLSWSGNNLSMLNGGVSVTGINIITGTITFPHSSLNFTATLSSAFVASNYHWIQNSITLNNAGVSNIHVFSSVPVINNTSTGYTALFNADPTVTAHGGNLYGYRSNIASGTNRWNFYASGSAANYFGGDIIVGETGRYMLNDAGTTKTAIDRTATGILRIGGNGDFNTITTAVNNFVSSVSGNFNISKTGGSIAIDAQTAGYPVTLRTVGDANVNNGITLTKNGSITASANNHFIASIIGTFAHTGTGAGNQSALDLNFTVNQSSVGSQPVQGIDIRPILTNVLGSVYGVRSRLNANPAGGGTAWNIYADGSAANYFGGDISVSGIVKIGNTTSSSSSTTGALQVVGGVGIGGTVNIGASNQVGKFNVFNSANGEVATLYGTANAGTATVYIGNLSASNTSNSSALSFILKNSNGTGVQASIISSNLTVPTAASETSKCSISTYSNGVLAERLSIIGDAIAINGDIIQDSTKAYYLGNNATDGTWRIIRSGNDLVFQKRESGVYVTKQTMTA